MTVTTQAVNWFPLIWTGGSLFALGLLVIYGKQLQERWPRFWRD